MPPSPTAPIISVAFEVVRPLVSTRPWTHLLSNCARVRNASAPRSALRAEPYRTRWFPSSTRDPQATRPQPCICTTPQSLICQYVQRRHASSGSKPEETLQKTALFDLHVANGGKMVPFGGFSMPVQYTDLGVGESHKWTREKASLFDVGHM